MTDLSPGAQAVVTAIKKFDWESGHFTSEDIWMLSREVTAAALRAAVDQVLPLYACSLTSTRGTTRLGVRQKLLAIAAELEGAQ